MKALSSPGFTVMGSSVISGQILSPSTKTFPGRPSKGWDRLPGGVVMFPSMEHAGLCLAML